MKTIILYQTFLGSTSKYANWLKDRIDADLVRLRDVRQNDLAIYDRVIVMSGTYAGQMPMTRFLSNYWPALKDKKVIAIAVGAAPSDNEQSKKSFETIPEEIRGKISYYKVPGRFFGFNKNNIRPENLEEILQEIGS